MPRLPAGLPEPWYPFYGYTGRCRPHLFMIASLLRRSAGRALLAGGCFLAAQLVGAQPAPTLLPLLERVADWQLAHPSEHATTDWTQGAGDAGIMALAEISPSPRFVAAMEQMGEQNRWEPGPRLFHADDYCVGQTYAELYFRAPDARRIAPLRERLDFIRTHPKDGNLAFVGKEKTDRWAWCDALFMGPPTWIRMWVITRDRVYLDFVVTHWWETSDYLYDPAEHLYFRDSTYFKKREANGQKVFWGRGNGWVLAGLVRVLQYLPAGHPARARFEQQFRELSERALGLQQPDGLWRASLLDPASYPLQETSGSGFFCYGLTWGINQGILERAKYEPAVRRGWAALVRCVTPEGKLTHVQPIGADPKRFPEDATEVYGVGAFLLAGSEVYRLDGGKPLFVRPVPPAP